MKESKETVITINTNDDGDVRVEVVFGLEFDRAMILSTPSGPVADAALAAINGIVQHIGRELTPDSVRLPEISAYHDSLTKEEADEIGEAMMGKLEDTAVKLRAETEDGSEEAKAIDNLLDVLDEKISSTTIVH